MEAALNRLVVFVENSGRRTRLNHKHALQLASEGKGVIEGQEPQQADEKPVKHKHSKKIK